MLPELRLSAVEGVDDRDKSINGLPAGGMDAAVNGLEGVCIRFDAESESDELKIENGSSFIGSCSNLVT